MGNGILNGKNIKTNTINILNKLDRKGHETDLEDNKDIVNVEAVKKAIHVEGSVTKNVGFGVPILTKVSGDVLDKVKTLYASTGFKVQLNSEGTEIFLGKSEHTYNVFDESLKQNIVEEGIIHIPNRINIHNIISSVINGMGIEFCEKIKECRKPITNDFTKTENCNEGTINLDWNLFLTYLQMSYGVLSYIKLFDLQYTPSIITHNGSDLPTTTDNIDIYTNGGYAIKVNAPTNTQGQISGKWKVYTTAGESNVSNFSISFSRCEDLPPVDNPPVVNHIIKSEPCVHSENRNFYFKLDWFTEAIQNVGYEIERVELTGMNFSNCSIFVNGLDKTNDSLITLTKNDLETYNVRVEVTNGTATINGNFLIHTNKGVQQEQRNISITTSVCSDGGGGSDGGDSGGGFPCDEFYGIRDVNGSYSNLSTQDFLNSTLDGNYQFNGIPPSLNQDNRFPIFEIYKHFTPNIEVELVIDMNSGTYMFEKVDFFYTIVDNPYEEKGKVSVPFYELIDNEFKFTFNNIDKQGAYAVYLWAEVFYNTDLTPSHCTRTGVVCRNCIKLTYIE